MFLTSNTNGLSSNTQAMKSLVFAVSGRGRYVEAHQVDPQHGGFSWGDVTTLTAVPRYPRQFAAGGFLVQPSEVGPPIDSRLHAPGACGG